MEGTKGFELEVLSRNDHVEDLRQNRVHDACRFYARKADTPKHGVGEISARHAARIPAGRIRRREHQILHSAMVFVRSIAGPAGRVTLG